MCFKQVFCESFYDFSFKEEKCQTLNQENIGENILLVLFFYRAYYFGERHDMIQCTTFKNIF